MTLQQCNPTSTFKSISCLMDFNFKYFYFILILLGIGMQTTLYCFPWSIYCILKYPLKVLIVLQNLLNNTLFLSSIYCQVNKCRYSYLINLEHKVLQPVYSIKVPYTSLKPQFWIKGIKNNWRSPFVCSFYDLQHKIKNRFKSQGLI